MGGVLPFPILENSLTLRSGRWDGSFQQLLAFIENDYCEDIEHIASYLSRIDVLQTKAYIAKEYKYCCPTIDESAQKSFVDAKALRCGILVVPRGTPV